MSDEDNKRRDQWCTDPKNCTESHNFNAGFTKDNWNMQNINRTDNKWPDDCITLVEPLKKPGKGSGNGGNGNGSGGGGGGGSGGGDSSGKGRGGGGGKGRGGGKGGKGKHFGGQ